LLEKRSERTQPKKTATKDTQPERRLLYIYAFSFLLVFALSLFVIFLGKQVKSDTRSINFERELMKGVGAVFQEVIRIESMARGFVATSDRSFLIYTDLYKTVPLKISQLEQTTVSDDFLNEKFKRLSALVVNKIKFSEYLIQTTKLKGPNEAKALMRAGRGLKLMDEIRVVCEEMLNYGEEKLLREREKRDKKLAQLVFVCIGLSGLSFFVLSGSFFSLQTQVKNLRLEQRRSQQAFGDLENIINTVRDPLIILEGDLKVSSASFSFYETFRLKSEDTEGKFIYKIGENEWNIPELRQLLGDVLSKQKEIRDFEATNIFPDLGKKTWLVSARKMNSGIEGVPRIVLSLKDITSRRDAEDLLRRSNLELELLKKELERGVSHREQELKKTSELLNQAIRLARIGIFDHELLEESLYMSSEMRTIMGIDATVPVIFQDFVSRVHPEDRASVLEHICDLHDPQGKGEYVFEHRLLLPDGIVRWISVIGKTFFKEVGENQKAARIVGVAIDITERVNNEKTLSIALERLAKEKLRLEQSNRDLERFASVAAHDLRAPVRSIRIWIEMLEQIIPKPHSTELEQGFHFIKLNAVKSSTLIDELLEIAKVRPAETPLETIDLNQLIEQILCNFKLEIEKTEASITKVNLPVVLGHWVHLESVFSNLIRNALTYRDSERKPEIKIECVEEPEVFKFCVQDNGIGIRQEFQTRIFEMFERLHTSEDYPGTGIGLALSKKIVETWGGKMWVESIPSKGSIFFFTFPKQVSLSERKIA
jgi:signal transduction histidine kinase/CHASE3 domain sensor protein